MKGINPWQSQREDGINIKPTFTFKDNAIELRVIELRPNGLLELGYRSDFVKLQDAGDT
ncbi:MAG: hypothetical protein AB7O48_16525 [Cyclobacteriaceae bacterium]